MKRRRGNDFDFCPICGVTPHHYKCSDTKLRSIDAAHKRSSNENDDGVYNLYEHSLSQRLHDGYEMLRRSDDSLDDEI